MYSVLHNRSNKNVSFELEFLDSYFREDEARMESLMNLAGPYSITIEANRKKTIHLKELLDLTDLPKHIDGGTSNNIHFKLIDGGIHALYRSVFLFTLRRLAD